MKKFMVFALFFATATSAMAETSLDARFGYLTGASNSLGSSTAQSTSGMTFQALRLKWNSQLAEGVTYKMRVNLVPFAPPDQKADDKSYSNTTKSASTMPAGTSLLLTGTPGNQPNDFVTYAQFDVKLADSLSLIVGRLADTALSGFEGQEAGSGLPFVSQGYWATTSWVGSGLVYSFPDSKGSAGVILANNTDETDTTRPAYGVFYAGNYGNLGVRVSYHFLPRNVLFDKTKLIDPPGSAGVTPITVGAQYKLNDLKLAFDIHQVSFPGLSSNKTDASTMTYLGRVFYTMGGLTPQLRFEQTSRQGLQNRSGVTDVTDAVTNMALSFDYKKQPADKMTYMLTLLSANTTYGSTAAYKTATGGDAKNANVSGQFVFASVRYDGVLQ